MWGGCSEGALPGDVARGPEMVSQATLEVEEQRGGIATYLPAPQCLWLLVSRRLKSLRLSCRSRDHLLVKIGVDKCPHQLPGVTSWILE